MSLLVPHASGGRPSDPNGVVAVGEVPPPEPPGGAEVHDPAERLAKPMPSDRLRGWLVAAALTVVGGIIRFWNLGYPTDKGTPVFDEKHYVPQAWQVLRNGGYEDNPGYELIVHPPLGKQLIAIGEWLFGYNAFGWRFSAAVVGTVCILLIVRAGRRLTRSTMFGAIAGVLLICDGVSHVQSRMGMLDIFHTVFVLAAFACMLVDRDQVRSRLAVAVREGWATTSPFGPRLGFRWWRFATGVMLGLATGVKWSGAFFLIAFAIMTLVWDAMGRKSAGVRHPWLGSLGRDFVLFVGVIGTVSLGLALFGGWSTGYIVAAVALVLVAWDVAARYFAKDKQGWTESLGRDFGLGLWSLGLIPVLTYVASYWAWFASETGIDRHVVGSKVADGGFFSFVPEALRGLAYYTSTVLNFHNNLLTPSEPHPWESKPWSWPMGLRAMLYHYQQGPDVLGCGRTDCISGVKLIGTPAMWWLAFPVLAWALWRAIGRLDWRYSAVLVAYAAAWLPWFSNYSRQMYYFYATPMAPFLILGITLALGEILGKASAGFERRRTGLLVVALYVGLVVANFIWLWPVLVGDPVTPWQWNAEHWLPSWS